MEDKEKDTCTLIYEKNIKRLQWYMWKHFPYLNPEDVHDIIQDVWRILVENIERVETLPEAAQSVWLMDVCHNRAVSFIRRMKRVVDWSNEFQNRMDTSVYAISLEDNVIGKVMAEELLSGLTKEDKRFLLGNSLRRTPKIKVRQNNAETCKAYRIRKKLKRMMKVDEWDH